MKRRHVLRTAATATAALAASVVPSRLAHAADDTPRYRLTLGQWAFGDLWQRQSGVLLRGNIFEDVTTPFEPVDAGYLKLNR